MLEACTTFTGYDCQSEGTRAEYLFDVLVASGLRDELEAPLLAALGERDGWDREQLLDLALLFAFDGSTAAEQAIERSFLTHAEEGERPGASHLVAATGLRGLATVARTLGRELKAADWVESYCVQYAEAHFGPEAVAQLASEGDADVRRYFDAVRAYRVEDRRARASSTGLALTLEELTASVLEAPAPVPKWKFRAWGRKASDAEVKRAAEALASGVPAPLRLAIVRAFVARPFPGPPQVLFDQLETGDDELTRATWAALEQIRHPAVRERVLLELGKATPSPDAIDALSLNSKPEDLPLLSERLAATSDRDEVHQLGQLVLDIFDDGGHPAWAPLLEAHYARGDCGICRRSIVGYLQAMGAASKELLLECRHDAYLDLRADAVQWLENDSTGLARSRTEA